MKKTVFIKYSTERDNEFKIITSIMEDDEGIKWVEKRAAHKEAQPHIASLPKKYKELKEYFKNTDVEPISCNMLDSKAIFSFVEGESLESRLDRYIEDDNLKDFLNEIKNYKKAIISNVELVPFRVCDDYIRVFGENFPEDGSDSFLVSDVDLIFANIIIQNKKYYIIDYEWVFDFPVPINFILFRALSHYRETSVNRKILLDNSIYGFLGISQAEKKLYEKMDSFFQRYIAKDAVLTGKMYETLGRKNVFLKDFLEKNNNLDNWHEIQVFYDCGSGFCEENSYKLYKPLNEIVDINIEVQDNTKVIRIDPGLKPCVVKIMSKAGMCERFYNLEISTNGEDLGEGSYLFPTDDPQIYFQGIKENTSTIVVKFELQVMSPLFVYDLCKTIDSLKDEKCDMLNSISSLYETQNALEQKVETQEELIHELDMEIKNKEIIAENAEHNYQMIVNSRLWRLFKPFRLVVSKLKKIRLVQYMGKTVISLKRYGIRETINIIGKKLGNKKFTTINSSELSKEEIQEDIKFSIIVPLYNTELQYLQELLDSISGQDYSNWELILGDASEEKSYEIGEFCKKYVEMDHRIRYFKIENKGISCNSNFCIGKAQGSYVVLCDHDDVLDRRALKITAFMIHEMMPDVLYTDEDHLDSMGRHIFPLYKPDWSIDLLRSQMYTCHLFVFKKMLFNEIGGFRKEYDGSQDYDLMLRFSEKTQNILHIPVVLYSWREVETSTSVNADAKPYAREAGLRALNDHLQREYGSGAQALKTNYPFVYEAKYGLIEAFAPLISIIIPMKDNYIMTEQCIKSIVDNSTYKKYEILLLNNRSEEEETFKWFEEIKKFDERIRIFEADFEFNWSKLNNFGMGHAKGDIYIFLNNDTKVISEDWLEKLCDYALRDDVGAVGPMLLYEDNTIQHAGIVVGMGGWADHVFKGMEPKHFGTPYISPMVNRNVMAVTGACMAIAKKTVQMIGGFDEEFIICGSDVEFCIRAYKYGLSNVFHAGVRLYHLESKSRNSYIPEVDFQKSYECYHECREFGDPYYNINLNIDSLQPEEDVIMDWIKIKEHIKNNRLAYGIYRKMKDKLVDTLGSDLVNIPEIQEINARKTELPMGKIRLNILLPSVDVKHVFGGISTALDFYKKLSEKDGFLRRIIVTDAVVSKETMIDLLDYQIVEAEEDFVSENQIVPFANRADKTIPVAKEDIFIATGWWTAYTIAEVMRWQVQEYGNLGTPLLYMVQDYEPGFYPWSSRYLMADSTYQLELKTIAIVNSYELYNFMLDKGYHFYKTLVFEPKLNAVLRKYLEEFDDKRVKRKKQILVYGRPSVERNAFALIVDALKKWVTMQPDIIEWNVLSAGESFSDIDLGNGKKLHSIGKVSLEEYAKIMLQSKIGLSLMVSPHPSYPPLEMSTFGMRVITNNYANKDLSNFNDNIVSLSNCSSVNIASTLCDMCDGSDGIIQKESDYVKKADFGQWDKIVDEVIKDFDLN